MKRLLALDGGGIRGYWSLLALNKLMEFIALEELEEPEAPHSFSGALISLIWAVELLVEPGGLSERIEITVSPTGEEILLGHAQKQAPTSANAACA